MGGNIRDLLPEHFAYVILTFCYSQFMIMYLAVKVGQARKTYDVKYPKMYSDKDQIFNCIQRAHQNTLEVFPSWIIFQLIAGLAYPLAASILGVIWVTSRFSYASGYYTGDPEKRLKGTYGYLGYFGLMILSITFALKLLGVM